MDIVKLDGGGDVIATTRGYAGDAAPSGYINITLEADRDLILRGQRRLVDQSWVTSNRNEAISVEIAEERERQRIQADDVVRRLYALETSVRALEAAVPIRRIDP